MNRKNFIKAALFLCFGLSVGGGQFNIK